MAVKTTSMHLKDQHIMVSGGCSGIGWATACHAATAGAQVTVLDLTPPPAQVEGISYAECDVTRIEHWQQVASAYPCPQHLFLNAGVMSAPNGATADAYQFSATDAAAYQRIRAVNLDGVVFGLQTWLPLMPRDASVVVTASLAGLHAYPFDPLYALTKHGLVGLVKSLAPNLRAQGIKLHALCPDRVDTRLLPEATRSRGYLDPEVVAAAVCQLFNEPSSGFAWALDLQSGSTGEVPLRRVPGPGSGWRQRLRRLFHN
ncbi:MAG: SDR family oxidoreductase [Pseudomonadota bacterium]